MRTHRPLQTHTLHTWIKSHKGGKRTKGLKASHMGRWSCVENEASSHSLARSPSFLWTGEVGGAPVRKALKGIEDSWWQWGRREPKVLQKISWCPNCGRTCHGCSTNLYWGQIASVCSLVPCLGLSFGWMIFTPFLKFSSRCITWVCFCLIPVFLFWFLVMFSCFLLSNPKFTQDYPWTASPRSC